MSFTRIPTWATVNGDAGNPASLKRASTTSVLCAPVLEGSVGQYCPTLPSSTGAQSTLVVLARFNDAGLPASPFTVAQVGILVNDMSAYLSEVSFTQATLGAPAIRG